MLGSEATFVAADRILRCLGDDDHSSLLRVIMKNTISDSSQLLVQHSLMSDFHFIELRVARNY